LTSTAKNGMLLTSLINEVHLLFSKHQTVISFKPY